MSTKIVDEPVIHVDAEGSPYCGAEPQGALVVDKEEFATCDRCRILTTVTAKADRQEDLSRLLRVIKRFAERVTHGGAVSTDTTRAIAECLLALDEDIKTWGLLPDEWAVATEKAGKNVSH